MKQLLIKLTLLIAVFSMPVITHANYFLEAGVDTTTAVGQFKIILTDEYAEMWGVKEITSPPLIDTQAKIGRSRPHYDGSQTDIVEGAIICEDGNKTGCFSFIPSFPKDSDFTSVPKNSEFNEGPLGVEEIHTQVLSLNLIDSGKCGIESANAVRAGSIVPNIQPSLGEVESLNSSDNFYSYPAEGFFNLFMEVDVDWNKDEIVDVTLFNNYPIILQNRYSDIFPSDKFYIKDSNNFSIPIYEKISNTHVGWIIMFGQSNAASNCDITKNTTDKNNFDKKVLSVELASFTAIEDQEIISLKWEAKTEINCSGYHLWRAKKSKAGEFVDILRLTEQPIPSSGGVLNKAVYFYDDVNAVPKNLYYYGLEDVTYDNVSTIHFEDIISTTVRGRSN